MNLGVGENSLLGILGHAIQGYGTTQKESDRNVALYANDRKKGDGKKQNYKQFKGNCNYCRIQGHKSTDCCKCKAVEKNNGEGAKPMERQNENGNNCKRCWNCKEKGHILKNCLNKQKDQMDAFFVGITLSNEETEMMQ